MLEIIQNFDGLVIIDEAYIDFAPGKSFLPELDKYPNLVILQTFSKAWGMAGIRLGMAFAASEIIQVLNKIKYPYNLNILTQQKALELLDNKEQVDNGLKC
jgi:histidinol-phosphate aminotransferase